MPMMTMSVSSDRLKEKYMNKSGKIILKSKVVQGQDRIKTGIEIDHMGKEISVKDSNIEIEIGFIMLKQKGAIEPIYLSKVHP